jgi:hypothetical protein
MRFRPRHYLLIVIILALGLWNLLGSRRAHRPPAPSAVTSTPSGPVPQSPAWQAFDHAATLRDAPDAQFQPTLDAFQHQLDAVASGDARQDLNGCHTWLMFYRQGARHAAPTDSWRQRSTTHLESCVSQHRDISQ